MVKKLSCSDPCEVHLLWFQTLQRTEQLHTEGVSAVHQQQGTRREETPSDLLRATELHLNTVENQDDDERYSEEDEEIDVEMWSDDEAPPRKRQHVEEEDDEYELSNLGSSSSSLWSSSPTLDSIPSMDAHFSSEHFCRRRRRRMEMSDEEDSDEEAPPRTRLRNLGSNSSSLWTLSPTLDFIPIIDSPSSDDFWWRMMMRRRELMGGDENNYEEAPHAGWEAVEPEDDEFEVFEHINLDRTSSPSRSLSPSLDLMSFIDSTGEEFFAWVRQNEDIDDMSAYDNMPHHNSEVRVHQIWLVFITIYIISLDLAGDLSIYLLTVPILFFTI
ncbi:hypothetical protein KOW79_013715 [Hemibagrus wyckioides]|uniref:Uncharacterized protein n=1 Tax=Hemibagrus wyckioides TaxID=337641 RepID=A0A9D3SKD4_9TELE|nr:hypothetical protein KOW79_013715 [Hemibagrus wyckioides]